MQFKRHSSTSAAVSSHSSFSATSRFRFSDSNYFPTAVFAQQPITLTESTFIEPLTFWPERSTTAWLKRNSRRTIYKRGTLVLLLLNIFTKNQGFTKVNTLLGINDTRQKKKSSARFFRTSQIDHHQHFWPHCGWLNNYNTTTSSSDLFKFDNCF